MTGTDTDSLDVCVLDVVHPELVAVRLPLASEEDVLLTISGLKSGPWDCWSGTVSSEPAHPEGGIVCAPSSTVVHESNTSVTDASSGDVAVLKVLTVVVVVVSPLSLVIEESDSTSVDSSVSESRSLWPWASGDHVPVPDAGVVWSPLSTVVHVLDSSSVHVSGLDVATLNVLGPVLVVVSPLTIIVEESHPLAVDSSVSESWPAWCWSGPVLVGIPKVGVISSPSSAIVHVSDSTSVDIASLNIGTLEIPGPVGVVVSPLTLVIEVPDSASIDGSVSKSWFANSGSWYAWSTASTVSSIVNSRKHDSSSSPG